MPARAAEGSPDLSSAGATNVVVIQRYEANRKPDVVGEPPHCFVKFIGRNEPSLSRIPLAAAHFSRISAKVSTIFPKSWATWSAIDPSPCPLSRWLLMVALQLLIN